MSNNDSGSRIIYGIAGLLAVFAVGITVGFMAAEKPDEAKYFAVDRDAFIAKHGVTDYVDFMRARDLIIERQEFRTRCINMNSAPSMKCMNDYFKHYGPPDSKEALQQP